MLSFVIVAARVCRRQDSIYTRFPRFHPLLVFHVEYLSLLPWTRVYKPLAWPHQEDNPFPPSFHSRGPIFALQIDDKPISLVSYLPVLFSVSTAFTERFTPCRGLLSTRHRLASRTLLVSARVSFWAFPIFRGAASLSWTYLFFLRNSPLGYTGLAPFSRFSHSPVLSRRFHSGGSLVEPRRRQTTDGLSVTVSQIYVLIGFTTQTGPTSGTEYFDADVFQCRLHPQIIYFECTAVIMTRGVWRIKAGVFSPPLVTIVVFPDSLCTSRPPSSNCDHHDLLQSLLCSLFHRSRSRRSSS